MKSKTKVVVGVIIAVLVTGAVLFAFYSLPGDSRRQEISSTLFASVSFGKEDLVVNGWVSQNKVYHGQRLRFWLTFENHSKQKITNLKLLEFEALGQTSGGLANFPSTILPGETKTVTGEFHPPNNFGRFRIITVFAWLRDGPQESRGSLSLGPIEVTTESYENLVRLGNRIAKIGKDLTLPIVLALLGYWFQRQQSERDKRLREEQDGRDQAAKRELAERDEKFQEKQAERDFSFRKQQTDREEKLQREREKRDRRQQIWNSILPRFHEYAEKHYLPIVASIRVLDAEWKALRETQSESRDTRPFLYRLLIILRRMKSLREAKGGFYFKDRTAESVVSMAWWIFARQIEERFTLRFRDEALSMICESDTYSTFLSKFPDSVLEREWHPRLNNWIRESSDGGIEAHLTLLEIMRAAIIFEANRPFDEYWYDTPHEFSLTGPENYHLPPHEKAAQLREQLSCYVKSVERYKKDWLDDVGTA